MLFKLFIEKIVSPRECCGFIYNFTMPNLLGSSPLGLSFFSKLGGGSERPRNNEYWLKSHAPYDEAKANEVIKGISGTGTTSVNQYGSAGSRGSSGSSGSSGAVGNIPMDYGIGARTFGDKVSIFTHNSKLPRTFHVGSERSISPNTNSLADFIKSEDKVYDNNWIDEYSSINKIVEFLKGGNNAIKGGNDGPQLTAGRLQIADFAYLKNLGVFPANRLIIARRFMIGIGDDLLRYESEPVSVIPSWFADGANPVDITFGEAWTDVQQLDLAALAGELSKEYSFEQSTIKKTIDNAGGILTLPGFTEWMQYYLFEEAGIIDKNQLQLLPQGNPNIIRKAQTRSTYLDNASFSGLQYSFSVNINAEYEIKYIDGIDPTNIYFDIISNLLSFGTSESQFQFDGRFNEKARNFIDIMSGGDFKKIMEEVGKILGKLLEVGKNIVNLVDKMITNGKVDIAGQEYSFTQIILSSQIKKLRLKFIGIINALTGSPSGIYHVTIGHPLRPIFCSGDLVPAGSGSDGMKITLGPELGYNNLPTSIKFSCTLKNARPCGLQEIFKKFSPSKIRNAQPLSSSQSIKASDEFIRNSIIQRGAQTRVRPVRDGNPGVPFVP